MASLYTSAWHSLLKLLLRLWSFILYLRSFSPQPTQPSSTTPKPRKNRQPEPEVDLERGRAALGLLSDLLSGLPSNAPLSPCFRRPRAATLSAYSPPCAKSTPRRTAASRSSGVSLPTAESGHETPADTMRRLSDESLCSFVTALSTYSYSEAIAFSNDSLPCQYRNVTQVAESEGIRTGLSKFIVNHRDSRYVHASRIRGMRLKDQVPLPFKGLSAAKTLSLAPSVDILHERDHKREPFTHVSASLMSFETSFPKEEIGYLEQSCSVDRGLLVMQQFLMVSQGKDEEVDDMGDENVARRPRSITLPIQDDGHLVVQASSNGDPSKLWGEELDSMTQHRDTLEAKQLLARWRSGFGLYDVSHVKRMFSIMRSGVEQDGQDVRNMFNRESVWACRKSLAPSTGVKYRSRLFSTNMQLDENACLRQGKTGRKYSTRVPFTASHRTRNKAFSVTCFNRTDTHGKSPHVSRPRHRSATYGLHTSPSMRHQLVVEKIKRQRIAHQEKIARMKHRSFNQGVQDTYEWFAEDPHVQGSCS